MLIKVTLSPEELLKILTQHFATTQPGISGVFNLVCRDPKNDAEIRDYAIDVYSNASLTNKVGV